MLDQTLKTRMKQRFNRVQCGKNRFAGFLVLFQAFVLLATVIAIPKYVSASDTKVWVLLEETSKLGFTATQSGAEFDGIFREFGGTIHFDPSDLAGSMVDISIDLTSVTTYMTDRDNMLPMPEWFDTATSATAN